MPISVKKIAKCTFKFDYVSKIFVERELKSLKRHKATVDNIPTNMLKDSASVIIAKPLFG